MIEIAVFEGQYRFLSNFYLCPIEFEGRMYPSVENAYQAAKTMDLKRRAMFESISPKDAKRFGRSTLSILRIDWPQIKTSIMLELLQQKFRYPDLRQKLVETWPAELIEGNWWHDEVWGVCRGKGENRLGELLMYVRDVCRAEDDLSQHLAMTRRQTWILRGWVQE